MPIKSILGRTLLYIESDVVDPGFCNVPSDLHCPPRVVFHAYNTVDSICEKQRRATRTVLKNAHLTTQIFAKKVSCWYADPRLPIIYRRITKLPFSQQIAPPRQVANGTCPLKSVEVWFSRFLHLMSVLT